MNKNKFQNEVLNLQRCNNENYTYTDNNLNTNHFL